ncbi:MAG: creatininase family protein [Deltaproteobacteria bacterium]|nr:creatininase family protein [Deltaproteobacteria bacterium]
MKKSYILDMTWTEFRDCVDERTAVLIPMGSTELEGPHLPLGVDSLVADAVAGSLIEEEGVLVGPGLPVGYSAWFSPFPGTISLEQETLTHVITEYSASLMRHGVRLMVFLNAHRGNNASIDAAARSLVLEYPVRIGMLSIWKIANDLAADKRGLIREGGFTHGGEIMTSLILALRPGLVVKENMKPDAPGSPPDCAFQVKNSLGDVAFKGSVQTLYQHVREITDSGVFGDPTRASAEKGKTILDLVTDYVRDFVRQFRTLPLPERRK